MDAGWAIKGWAASTQPLEVLAERESIYRLLGQTTPENLNRDYAAYTLDPHTRSALNFKLLFRLSALNHSNSHGKNVLRKSLALKNCTRIFSKISILGVQISFEGFFGAPSFVNPSKLICTPNRFFDIPLKIFRLFFLSLRFLL